MTLDQFLERLADTREDGDGWVAVCPSHADSHPSLRVAVGTKGKVILKCRAGCETKDVLAALNMTFKDLGGVETGGIVKRATSTDEPAGDDDVARLAEQLAGYVSAVKVDDAVCQYANGRFGLAWDDFLRLGLGMASDLGGGPRLVVPFRDQDGVARGFQARALSADASVRWIGAKSPEGASWAKVGWFPGTSGWNEVVITEGPGDALTACAAGYDTIGVRGAALANNEAVVAAIRQMVGDRPVVVFGDNDDSGRKFSATLVAELSKAGVQTAATATPQADDISAWREADPAAFNSAFISTVTLAMANAPSAVQARINALNASDLNDLGMARRLLERINSEGGVRYAPEAGFHLLDNGVWELDRMDYVRTLAQRSARALFDEVDELTELASRMPDGPERDAALRAIAAIARFARHANNTLGLNSMLRELQSLRGVAVAMSDFDTHLHLLAARNGVINLKTGELLPHDPTLLLTRRVDLDYTPEAQCPRWERFMDEVFPDQPDMPEFIQRLTGYGVTGHVDEQTFVVHFGTGSNGKSVFIDTLTQVFRPITVTTPFATFETRPAGGIPNDIASLNGARLVMASEGEQGKPMAEAVLKRVTGKDFISARFMRREFFEFKPQFLLMLATNAKPNFRGQDEGLWRRVKLVEWSRYFAPTERDHYLETKLLAEAEGILSWVVRGSVAWFQHGLKDPDCVRLATESYRETSDALGDFIAGRFIKDRESTVLGKVLWESYLTWLEEERLPLKEQWSRKAFFGALEERGFPKTKTNVGVAFRGIRKAAATSKPEAKPAPTARPANTDGPDLDDVLEQT